MTTTLEGDLVLDALRVALDAVTVNEELLGRLDAAAGDGDHGRGMVRGFRAAVAAAEGYEDGAERLRRAGSAFSDAAGGASGMLIGTLLLTLGDSLDATAVDSSTVARAFRAALDAIVEIGGAQPGDKTLIDALAPFVETLEECAIRKKGIAECWTAAADAAEHGAAGTADLVARRGRSARLGERSRGVQDPGATSLSLTLGAIGTLLNTRCPRAA